MNIDDTRVEETRHQPNTCTECGRKLNQYGKCPVHGQYTPNEMEQIIQDAVPYYKSH